MMYEVTHNVGAILLRIPPQITRNHFLLTTGALFAGVTPATQRNCQYFRNLAVHILHFVVLLEFLFLGRGNGGTAAPYRT